MNKDNGYTGLSFPMRLSNKGGLKLSTTSSTDFSHIEESIIQILNTNIGERAMEVYFGSTLSTHIFDPTDESSMALIKHEILEVLTQYEPRISLTASDILLEENKDTATGGNSLFVTIHYVVTKYNRSGDLTINMGGTE